MLFLFFLLFSVLFLSVLVNEMLFLLKIKKSTLPPVPDPRSLSLWGTSSIHSETFFHDAWHEQQLPSDAKITNHVKKTTERCMKLTTPIAICTTLTTFHDTNQKN